MKEMIRNFSLIFCLVVFTRGCFAQSQSIILDFQEGKSSTIYFERFGEGMPIIILHSGSAAYLEPVFSERDHFSRIYINPPGIGKSSPEDWIQNADDHAEILYQAINEIIPEGPFAIGGFSYFGYTSMALAERFASRINGLLLICPVTVPEFSERLLPENQKSYTDSIFFNSLSIEEQEMMNGLVIKNEESFYAIRSFSDHSVMMNTNLWNRIKRNGYAISQIGEIKGSEAPVLLLLGLQDTTVGYIDALALIDIYPSISVVIADYASHSLPFEQYELLKLNVNLWLDRIQIFQKTQSF